MGPEGPAAATSPDPLTNPLIRAGFFMSEINGRDT